MLAASGSPLHHPALGFRRLEEGHRQFEISTLAAGNTRSPRPFPNLWLRRLSSALVTHFAFGAFAGNSLSAQLAFPFTFGELLSCLLN